MPAGARERAMLATALAGVALAGCARFPIVNDGTSVSWGPSNHGALVNPTQLPVRGDGFWMPPRWASRGLHYGTDELVSVVRYAAERVRRESPGALLGVADLSRRAGGPSAWHGSHQNGRDVDLLFFARDEAGDPVRLASMPTFGSDGVARAVIEEGRALHFDVERNWLLVRAILENPVAGVQWIFVSEALKQQLLDHAIARGEPLSLVLRASYILHQPSDAPPHGDHFHVRIFCPLSDRDLGCRDRGWLRWHKKGYKHPLRVARAYWPRQISHAMDETSVRALLALSAIPFRGFVPAR